MAGRGAVQVWEAAQARQVLLWGQEAKHGVGFKSGEFGGGAGESRVLFVGWCAEIGVFEVEDWVEFALKAKLRLKAVQAAREELNRLRAIHSSLIVKLA